MNRIEAEKMYQAAVRCVGEGGSVRGGPAEILRACNRTREQFDRDAAATQSEDRSRQDCPDADQGHPRAPRVASQVICFSFSINRGESRKECLK